MQNEILLSYKGGTFSGEDFVRLIHKFVDFHIDKFSVDEIKDGEITYSTKWLERIGKCTSEAELMFRTNYKSEKQNEEFWIMESAIPNSPQSLCWILNDRMLDLDLIYELISHPNFVSGFISDSDFLMWQNERSINNYEQANRDHKKLSKIFDRNFGLYLIDISKNPGRSTLMPNLYFSSNYMMFFGNRFYNYVPKDRILTFQGAARIDEIYSGVIVVKLFEEISQSATEPALRTMAEFRTWIGIDDLERKLTK